MQPDHARFHLFLHSAELVEERLRLRLAELGMLPRQARVLDALARMGEVSQAELAREFAVTPASMSTMTVRMIAAGLILRTVDPDELRSNLLSLSDKGRSLLGDVKKAWADVDGVMDAALGPERAAQLAQLMLDLRDALGGHVPGGKPDSPPDDGVRTP